MWRGHRLRARSNHRELIECLRRQYRVTVTNERTACGVDVPEGVEVAIEINGEVSCEGCRGYARRGAKWAETSRGEAAAA